MILKVSLGLLGAYCDKKPKMTTLLNLIWKSTTLAVEFNLEGSLLVKSRPGNFSFYT